MIHEQITKVCQMHQALYGKSRIERAIFSFDVIYVSDPDYHSVDGNYRLIRDQRAWIDGTLISKTVYDRYEQRIPPDNSIDDALCEILEEISETLTPLYETMCAKQKAAAEEQRRATREAELRPYREAASKVQNWRKNR